MSSKRMWVFRSGKSTRKAESLMKEKIYSNQAPNAIGPYSQAIKVGDHLYLSGQLGLIPETGKLAEDFAAQCQQVFDNLNHICTAAGAQLADIVKLSVFLTNLEYFPELNAIMIQQLTEPYPARTVVEVAALPKGGMVMIDAVVYRPSF